MDQPSPEWVRRLAALDQATRATVDALCPFLWALYSGLLKQGFNEYQSFELTRDYMAQIRTRFDDEYEEENDTGGEDE